jgi:hypothetical protein
MDVGEWNNYALDLVAAFASTHPGPVIRGVSAGQREVFTTARHMNP